MTDLTQRLLDARAEGDYSPDFLAGAIDLPQALDLQLAVLQQHLDAGRTVGGWKVGLTSEASRTRLGADERPFGFVLADHTLASGATVDSSTIRNLSVETEMCFTVGTDIGNTDVTPDDIFRYVTGVAAGFELNEARPGSVQPDFHAMVTDCLTNWGIVAGTAVTPHRPPSCRQLKSPWNEMVKSSSTVYQATSSTTMPCRCVAWSNSWPVTGSCYEPVRRSSPARSPVSPPNRATIGEPATPVSATSKSPSAEGTDT